MGWRKKKKDFREYQSAYLSIPAPDTPKFAKTTVMDGINSGSNELGKFITERFMYNGSHSQMLNMANVTRHGQNRLNQATGNYSINISLIDSSLSPEDVAAYVSSKVGGDFSIADFRLAYYDFEWLVDSYVAEHYPDHYRANIFWYVAASDVEFGDDEELDDPDFFYVDEPEDKKTVKIFLIDKDLGLTSDILDSLPDSEIDQLEAESTEVIEVQLDLPVDHEEELFLYVEYNKQFPVRGEASELPVVEETVYTFPDVSEYSQRPSEPLTETLEELTTTTTTYTLDESVEPPEWVETSQTTTTETVTAYTGEESYIKTNWEDEDTEREDILDILHGYVIETVEEEDTSIPGSKTVTVREEVSPFYETTLSTSLYVVSVDNYPVAFYEPLSETGLEIVVNTEQAQPIPPLPIRHNFSWLRTGDAANAISLYVKKTLGSSSGDFIDELSSEMGGDVGKVQDIDIYFAVPINTRDTYAAGYIFEFFKEFTRFKEDAHEIEHRKQQYLQEIEAYNDLHSDLEAFYEGSVLKYRVISTGQVYTTLPPEYDAPEPYRGPVRSQSMVVSNSNTGTIKPHFRNTISWKASFSTETYSDHNLRINESRITKIHPVKIGTRTVRTITGSGKLGPITVDVYSDPGAKITKRVSEEFVEIIDVTSMSSMYVNRYKGTHIRGQHLSSDNPIGKEEGDTLLLIPLIRELMYKCNGLERSQAAICGTNMMLSIGYTKKVKRGWYKAVSSVGKFLLNTALFSVRVLTLGIGYSGNLWKDLGNLAVEGVTAIGLAVGVAMKGITDALSGLFVMIGIPRGLANVLAEIGKVVLIAILTILTFGGGTAALSMGSVVGSLVPAMSYDLIFSLTATMGQYIINSKLKKAEASHRKEMEKYKDASDQINEIMNQLNPALAGYDTTKFFDSGVYTTSSGITSMDHIPSLSESISSLSFDPNMGRAMSELSTFGYINLSNIMFSNIDTNLVEYIAMSQQSHEDTEEHHVRSILKQLGMDV